MLALCVAGHRHLGTCVSLGLGRRSYVYLDDAEGILVNLSGIKVPKRFFVLWASITLVNGLCFRVAIAIPKPLKAHVEWPILSKHGGGKVAVQDGHAARDERATKISPPNSLTRAL